MTPLAETTRNHVIQWRAFVGPPFKRDDDAAFWDWSDLDYGAVYDPVPADTSLASNLATAATSAVLTSGTGWPTAGGFWVGPVGGYGGAWEYCTYTGKSTNTLTGLTRETVDSENTGAHLAQSQVIFWWPLTENDGTLTLSERLDAKLSLLDWQHKLQGVNIPQAALRNGHLVLVQTRYQVKGDTVWSNWINELVGWIQNPQARDDATTVTQWQIETVSSGGLLASLPAQGLRVGTVNMALGGSASGTQEIAAWYKASWTGEFSGSNVALDHGQAVDGKADTLYLSERYLGAANKPDEAFPFQHEIYEVHIAPYTGQGKGYRWFQVIGDGMPTFRLVNQLGYAITPAANAAANHVIVFAENEALFRAENPACTATVVQCDSATGIGYCDGSVGVTNLASAGAYTVADWWDSLAPAAGALYYYGNAGATERFHGGILWGTVDAGDVEDEWGSTFFTWSGANIAAPVAGQTIRRIFSGDKDLATGYVVDSVSNPGTFIGDGHRFYVLVQANKMGLTLTNAITASSPGAAGTLYLSLGDAACVDGLDAAGTVQIGSEQITYSAKTATNAGLVVTARGANSTTAAIHAAGEVIYQVDHGVATDALPLDSIIVRRTTGKPVPKDFKVYASANIQTPRLPDEDEPDAPAEDVTWTQDYELLDTVTSNSSEAYLYTHPIAVPTPIRRYRWFLCVVTAMTTTPYQLAINELEIIVADDVYSATTYLASGTVFAAAQAILRGCGIPDGAIVDGGSTPTITDYTTAPDLARGVLADLGDMARVLFTVGRDSKITVANNPYLTGTPSSVITWTKTTASAYAPDWAWGRQIGQVNLTWFTLDGVTQSVTKYPTTPDVWGDVLQAGPVRVVDATAATTLAKKYYLLARLPFGATIEAAGAPLAARPGIAHGVTWQLDPDMLALARQYFLDSVDHRLHDSQLSTVVHGAQIGREDER